MKSTFTLGILLGCLLARAQGPQQLVTVPYDAWAGATVKGWLYLPADYHTTTKNYPVVFFYHGLGESGSNPYTLLNNGIPKLIADGMRPDNIVNPVDGQAYSFIVLSVQHWSWSPNPAWLPYELNWLKQNYRVDTNRVYVTGLSAGGQQSFGAATLDNHVSRLIAAAVPMSPAAVWPYDPNLIDQNKIETWFFSGNSDGGYTVNATNYSADCNTVYPGSSKLSIYPGGHCCWNTYYQTSWHDPATGRSVWEWMLMHTRETANPNPLPVNFISLDIKKLGAAIQLTWKVGQEENVMHYEVEKSNDGKNFTKAGQVNAFGKELYVYNDNQLPSKYYRVKSVDVDGKFKYSSVVKWNGARSAVVLKAFPLPAREEIKIQHPTAGKSSRITLHAIDGSTIKTISPGQGSQQTPLDLSALRSGSYFVRFEDENGQMETVKILKQ